MKYKKLEFHRKMPWRTLQIGISIATIVTGFCAFLPLSYVFKYFHWQCPLHANIRLLSMNGSSVLVDKQRTVWGSNSECIYTTFTPVFASIHAFIWCWFFLLMKALLKREHHEFPMLVFSSVLHSLIFVDTFVASCILSAGFGTWCQFLTQDVKRLGFSMSCSDTQNLMWPNVFDDNEIHAIYGFLRTAQVSGWLQSSTVLCQTLVGGYKLYTWIVYATDGYLDIRKCGRSPSLQSPTFSVDNLLDDNDNNSISYSSTRETIGNVTNVDLHVDVNAQNTKDVVKESL